MLKRLFRALFGGFPAAPEDAAPMDADAAFALAAGGGVTLWLLVNGDFYEITQWRKRAASTRYDITLAGGRELTLPGDAWVYPVRTS